MVDGSGFPPILSAAEIARLFPDKQSDPSPQVFELGLVLGGTVSTGAYTAGTLDFLIEALDAWEQLKIGEAANSPTADAMAPLHKISLEIVTGASGGSVCTAVLSRALPYFFPHVDANYAGGPSGNPFYDLWVENFDISALLTTGDLADGAPLKSLLDSSAIDQFAQNLLNFPPAKSPPLNRTYVANPLRTILTLANLRGIPYLAGFNGDSLGEYFVDHADYGRFAVEVPGGTVQTNPLRKGLRPDEFAVTAADAIAWKNFAEYAKGSGAFPLGFRARDLDRPMDHLRYRVAVLPDDNGRAIVQGLRPAWGFLADPLRGVLPPTYSFTVVDGGAFDNEPIELCRTWLAGMIAHNPRNGLEANRAILLIDPLASDPDLADLTRKPMFNLVFPLIDAMIAEARYKTSDLVLMADSDVFSRFILTPKREIPAPIKKLAIGSDAVAGSRLGAFAGFLDKAYRRHDYLLGRANCWNFLRNEFTLPARNHLFEKWTDFQRRQYAVGQDQLPIIPLVNKWGVPEPIPNWPKTSLNTAELTNGVATRLKAILENIENNNLQPDVLLRSILLFARGIAADEIAGKIVSAIESELRNDGLA